MQIVYCILAIIVGFLIEVYTYRIVRTFGHLDWAERHMGPGGSYAAWRIIGVILIMGAFWIMVHGMPGQA
jgi:hypothetical protein